MFIQPLFDYVLLLQLVDEQLRIRALMLTSHTWNQFLIGFT